MNRVMLLGNLTSDPLYKKTETVTLSKMIVAVDRDKNSSDFFKAVAFGKTADYINLYAKKGSKIALEGRLSSDKYVDKNGANQYVVEVIVDRIWILSRKIEAVEPVIDLEKALEEHNTNKVLAKLSEDDDLPF